MKVQKTALSVLLSLGIAVVLSTGAFAGSARVSKSDNGLPVGDSSMFPALSSAVGVTAMAVISTASSVILYGVHLTTRGSANTNDFLILYGTGTIGGVTQSTLTAVRLPGMDVDSNINSGIVQFNPPLRVYNGLSARSTACGAGVTGWCYTVIYDTVP